MLEISFKLKHGNFVIRYPHVGLTHVQTISCYWSLSILPENIRKPRKIHRKTPMPEKQCKKQCVRNTGKFFVHNHK